MAPKRSASSTAPQAAAKLALIITKLSAIACVLTLLICGTSLLRGSHPGRNALLGTSFSMVSFSGIAAKAAGSAPPYVTTMHWFMNSFGWEWLQPTTELDAANYLFVQPTRPLQMPRALHDVADALYRAGHMLDTCQSASATETCIRASKPFFAAFDSVSPINLNNTPAFVFYLLALIVDVASPAVFSCLGFFSDGGVERRQPWLRTGALALPAAFHVISASILTFNASALVAYLNQFPQIPANATIGFRFLIVSWCGVIAEMLAVVLSVIRVFLLQLQQVKRKSQNVRSIPSGSRMKAEHYQELFSISQALSGPASTKMVYCINLIQHRPPGALLAFFIWSLPGALGMLALSIGVSNIGSSLPRAVYALLSGLNAATVGIIALAAVELSHKAVTDKLTRTLVFLGAAAGMMYNALWYFPVLMAGAGCAAVVHDYRWVHRPARRVVGMARALLGKRNRSERQAVELSENVGERGGRTAAAAPAPEHRESRDEPTSAAASRPDDEPRIIPKEFRLDFSWKSGTAIILTFFASFIAVMIVRGVVSDLPILYRLFSNLYLAGTIIFGGGPVVIPLLREYIVAEGWVSPRDFLIGLAIAQSFPGPNFNFAVFLGGLTALNAGNSPVAGAVIAFVGIFTPGMVLVHGTMGVWGALRSRPWVKAAVRGVNAAAVGLIYTAVYRIWQVGYLDEGFQSGRSLGDDPWWVVVTATAYVGGRYYGIAAPFAILLGAAMGLVRNNNDYNEYTKDDDDDDDNNNNNNKDDNNEGNNNKGNNNGRQQRGRRQ
ncbi:chromate transporter [Colletotrichum karsti]|uniref:Chromate transporter n=1 Tax=Colletotrichum karsti TaxID=1095194 RepID=A0A9P6LD30_9PEZI|nr:chromate transporter [Colletotrichum karsti]KAF9870629.1 chromate transporter [Colletotrichum karsti]